MKVERIEKILTQVQLGLEKMLGRFAEVPTEETPAEEVADHSAVSFADALAEKEDGSYTITITKSEGKVTEFEVHSLEAPGEEEVEMETEAKVEEKVELSAEEETAKVEEVKMADQIKEL